MRKIPLLLFISLFFILPPVAFAQSEPAGSDSLRQMLLQASKITLAGDEILVYGVPQPSGPPKAVILEAQMTGKRLKARPKGSYKIRFADLGLLKTGLTSLILFPDGSNVSVEILALPPREFKGDRLDIFDRPGF